MYSYLVSSVFLKEKCHISFLVCYHRLLEGGRWKRHDRARDSMMAAVRISFSQHSRSM